jgi:hypothetical protein
MAGVIFVLVFGAIVLAWGIWFVGRTEQQKDAARKEELDDHKPPLADT